uniref:NADH dehydrogenase [ubiquinone] 1 alpha subcomplex subunit 13 n=1 Tax=Ornithodoros turicata TaxID=34597 RepID=A0A2R5LGJ7_9ACAR
MASANYKQDMPPAGGYAEFNYKRVPAKVWGSGYKLLGAYAAVTAFSFYMYFRSYRRVYLQRVEDSDGRIAVQPIVLAERDRAFLKQLKKNFEAEKELMKDVPGWEVGTLFGEPLYKTTPKGYHVDPITLEFFAHANPKDREYNHLFAYKNS